MNRFDDCLRWLRQAEGGYSNRKDDHGGPTNFGVTQIIYDRWCKDHGLAPQDVRLITDDEVSALYRSYYFNPARCSQLPIPVDLVMFDAWVQHRPDVAANFLEKAVGADEDGRIGFKTLRAVAAAATEPDGALSVALAIIDLRRAFYRRLATKDSSQAKYLRGWLNRMDHLQREISVHI